MPPIQERKEMLFMMVINALKSFKESKAYVCLDLLELKCDFFFITSPLQVLMVMQP